MAITYFCQGPGVRKNDRGSGEGVRKSKRLVSRRFRGDAEPQKEGELVPLEEPNGEEEEEEEKEEFAETLPVMSSVEKEEYARESSTKKTGSENSQPEETDSMMRRGRLPPEGKDPHQEAVEEEGEDSKVWICPACDEQDDGSPMIGCDQCDGWYFTFNDLIQFRGGCKQKKRKSMVFRAGGSK